MDKEVIFVHIPKTGGSTIRKIIKNKGVTIIDHNLNDKCES